MAVKITQKKPHAHIIVTKQGNITLKPGVTYVADELWAAAKDGSHATIRGKKVNTLELLVKEGHLEVEEGAKDPNDEETEGSSIVTRGERRTSYAGGLPGQGGVDISKRDEPEETTDDGSGSRRKRRG